MTRVHFCKTNVLKFVPQPFFRWRQYNQSVFLFTDNFQVHVKTVQNPHLKQGVKTVNPFPKNGKHRSDLDALRHQT